MLNFIPIDLQLHKIFKITQDSFFVTHCTYLKLFTLSVSHTILVFAFQTVWQ